MLNRFTAAIAPVAATIALAGCTDTGVLPMGPDTYSVSTRVALSGSSGAKGQALKEAGDYCTAHHREILVKDAQAHECALHGGCGEATVTFMCLDPGDPRYTAGSK